MDGIVDRVMDMLYKWTWMTAAVAKHIIEHNIDTDAIPELAC